MDWKKISELRVKQDKEIDEHADRFSMFDKKARELELLTRTVRGKKEGASKRGIKVLDQKVYWNLVERGKS